MITFPRVRKHSVSHSSFPREQTYELAPEVVNFLKLIRCEKEKGKVDDLLNIMMRVVSLNKLAQKISAMEQEEKPEEVDEGRGEKVGLRKRK